MSVEHTPAPLSPDELPRSAWLKFFDTFLQEKNIKWMLGLGGLILFASSLMLVTSHWQDYTPLWKSLVVMGYTVVLYVLGEVAYRQLGLRRTGTSLLAMTVLLIPISFLAVRVMHEDLSGASHLAGIVGLLLANTVFAAVAGRRILQHFLRQDQPTFLMSYLGLSLAGALVPGLPQTYAAPVGLLLWAMFAVGTIKVNRHVFWLGEEHRLPRIFGFFPILLLGTQFLTLFAFLAPGIELPWMGFGLVLTAVPVLMTANALAQVFEERTGNLVRPLPWSLVTPLLVGLGLCLVGVCLSFTEFRTSLAPVPTALLAALVLCQLARRTRHPGFVWAMWGGVLVAYQTSPIFFQELARSVIRQGAEAVSEARLPWAFYGLTYLPLLIVATLIAAIAARRDNLLFARPTRLFVVGLTSLLWAISFTHFKAMFPVGVALLAMCALELLAFREPKLRFGMVAAWVSLSLGLTPFLEQVLHWELPAEAFLWVMSLSAGLLLLPDRFLSPTSHPEHKHIRKPNPYAIGDLASFLMVLLFSAAWLVRWMDLPEGEIPWTSAVMWSGLLFVHALRWCREILSVFALMFAGVAGVLIAKAFGVAPLVLLASGILTAGGLLCVAMALHRVPQTRLSRAFAKPMEQVAGVALAFALIGFSLPRLLAVMAGLPLEYGWLWWPLLVPVAWSFDAARRWRSAFWTFLGSFTVLCFVGAVSVTAWGQSEGFTWLPLVWAGVGLLSIPLVPRPFEWSSRETAEELERVFSPGVRYVTEPIGRFATVLFVLLAVGTLPFFSVPARLASVMSLAGLFGLTGNWRNAGLRHMGLALLNWHLLSGVVQLLVPEAKHVLDLNAATLWELCLPLALAASVSRLVWNLSRRAPGSTLGEWVNFQRLMLLGLTCFGLIWSLKIREVSTALSLLQVIFAVSVFAVLAVDQIWQAVKSKDEAHVWTAEGIVLLAVGYLLMFDVIHLGTGLSMYAILLTGWAAWVVGYLSFPQEKWRVLSEPMFFTGYALPAVAVGVGIVRHFTTPDSLWLGMNSLALLFAAGFYFWRGIEERRNLWMLSAAAILNVALALLWRELDWHDPQLFAIPLGISILALVQWLKEEIPAKALDPLRYLGALVILVSPVFHILSVRWMDLLTLMVASVAVTLTAMGLRIRALMYTGTAFLVADLLAMVVMGSIDNPTLLWIAGILVGLSVMALAAYCEKHRELVLQRLRIVAAKLETWE